MKKKHYFYLTSVIFFIVAVVHLLKLVFEFQIQIFGMPYPLWLSWIEMIVGFYLSYVGFQMGKKEE